MNKPQTPKGFRDFLPDQAWKRQYVIDILRRVFESYGFEPLETPALEYEEVLLGKYGEEGDKLMYRLTDKGGRKLALRYDQTVPLARVVAQYQNELPIPFKRYQIQPVWRGENPQKGRFREFLQCDADIVGSSSPLADAEAIIVAAKSLEKLGFKNFKILINDRVIFEGFPKDATIIIDKLTKIGEKGVINELLKKKNIVKNLEEANKLFKRIKDSKVPKRLEEVFSALGKLGLDKNLYNYEPTIARGLDYYTGTIFEIEIEEYSAGSVCGGGRYDNLIGVFSGKTMPAVGFAFGFDRLVEAMQEFNLFPKDLASTKALVTIFSPDLKGKSIEASSLLRNNGISTELYPDEEVKLDKQLKYADRKSIPYVVVIGPEEAQKDMVTLKNMQTGEQDTLLVDGLIKKLS